MHKDGGIEPYSLSPCPLPFTLSLLLVERKCNTAVRVVVQRHASAIDDDASACEGERAFVGEGVISGIGIQQQRAQGRYLVERDRGGIAGAKGRRPVGHGCRIPVGGTVEIAVRGSGEPCRIDRMGGRRQHSGGQRGASQQDCAQTNGANARNTRRPARMAKRPAGILDRHGCPLGVGVTVPSYGRTRRNAPT